MTPATTATIETQRLLLRIPTDADTEPLAAFIEDPEFTRYIPKSTIVRTPWERAEKGEGDEAIQIAQSGIHSHSLNSKSARILRRCILWYGNPI